MGGSAKPGHRFRKSHRGTEESRAREDLLARWVNSVSDSTEIIINHPPRLRPGTDRSHQSAHLGFGVGRHLTPVMGLALQEEQSGSQTLLRRILRDLRVVCNVASHVLGRLSDLAWPTVQTRISSS